MLTDAYKAGRAVKRYQRHLEVNCQSKIKTKVFTIITGDFKHTSLSKISKLFASISTAPPQQIRPQPCPQLQSHCSAADSDHKSY